MAQLVQLTKQRLSEVSPSDTESVFRLQEDLELMEIMKTVTLDDAQIRQLAKHLHAQENLNHLKFARLAAHSRFIELDNK